MSKSGTHSQHMAGGALVAIRPRVHEHSRVKTQQAAKSTIDKQVDDGPRSALPVLSHYEVAKANFCSRRKVERTSTPPRPTCTQSLRGNPASSSVIKRCQLSNTLLLISASTENDILNRPRPVFSRITERYIFVMFWGVGPGAWKGRFPRSSA